MPDFITYPELSCLASDTVLVCNRYHGEYPTNNKNYRAVIYTCFGEVLSDLRINEMLESFPDSYVIIITARKYPDIRLRDARCSLFYMPSAYAWYSTKMPGLSGNFYSRKFVKRFLSLNNRAQWTRQSLAQMLIQFNLLDQCYFSYWCNDRWNEGSRLIYDQINEIIGKTWFNQKLDMESIFQKIPIRTELDDFGNFGNDWSYGNKIYYDQSFCSIVTETYIDENNDAFFTEKTMKPLAYRHPFLLISSMGALQSLTDMGFYTFSDFFDESYDSIDSPQLRTEKIFREILRLSQLSDSDIDKMYQAMIPRLQYNHDFFWNEWPKIYQRDIIDIKERISDIISKI